MKKSLRTETVDLGEFLGEGQAGFEDVGVEGFLDEESSEAGRSEDAAFLPDGASREAESGELKNRIAEYYLNKQLEQSLVAYGKIPESSTETTIGIGFIDIVDYSYISSWLSPRENQVFLNGLYTAFHLVLKRTGGYLNKISGDSMMFHFGGTIDPAVRSLPGDAAKSLIAQSLFRTCVDIQECCRFFNRADEHFIPAEADAASKTAMTSAFGIIRSLRENLAMVSSIDAMFQVRIRIGASMGQVCIGNFGPEGARQWDVIGNPVIEARRMEATAPVDGIRLGRELYETLESDGMAAAYLAEFRSKAKGLYRGIEMEELFRPASVILKDKKSAVFDSWAVQANPSLPEDVARLASSALYRDEGGPESIVELVKYYRGNRLVVQALEELFRSEGVRIRKTDLYRRLLPRRYSALLKARKGNEGSLRAEIQEMVGLYELLSVVGRYQDRIKADSPDGDGARGIDEAGRAGHLEEFVAAAEKRFRAGRAKRERDAYFNEVVLPYVFASIGASVLEFTRSRQSTAKSA